jgi:PST family polysaccharide transporter
VADPGGSPPQPRLTGAAVRSFLWAMLSFGSNKAVVFVTTLVLARLLAPADFGLVAGGLAVLAYLEVVLDLGVGQALVYERETGITRRVQTAFTVNVAVAAVLTALAVASAPAIAAFLRTPDAADLYRVLSLSLLVRGLGQVQTAVLQRDLDFRRRTAVDIARAVVRAGLSIPMAFAGLGAWALVWGVVGGELTSSIVAWRLTRFRPSLALDRAALRPLLGFGVTILTTRLVAEVSGNADYLIVGRRLGPTELGYYSVAWRLPELLIDSVLWVFSSVAFPVYTHARDRGAAAFKQAMLRALRLVTLFSFPVGVGLAVVSRDAILVLFSERWMPAAPIMALVALTMAILSVGYASGDLYPAMGRPGLLLRLDLALAVPIVTAFWFTAPYGITAVALVHLAVTLGYAPVRMAIANHYVHATMRESLVAMWPAICTSLGIAAVALPVRQLLEPGVVALVATIGGGLLGAVVALLVGAPRAIGDLRTLAASLRDR